MSILGGREEGTSSGSAPPTIIVPGPELAHKINQFASKLSTFDKRHAEELIAKTLASPKRNKFLYIEPSHVFYPYFLQKLTEYRQNPSLRLDKGEKKKGAGDGEGGKPEGAPHASSSSSSAPSGSSAFSANVKTGGGGTKGSTTTTTTPGGRIQVQGGTTVTDDPVREALLQKVEEEARKYEHDPHPPRYRLNLEEGTLEVPPLILELISLTAQYVAKYGTPFLEGLQAKQQRLNSVSFQFLEDKDPRHELFTSLIESYRLILEATNDANTEERLVDHLHNRDYVEEMIREKMKYIQATLARRQAALLTDEILRQKLQWSYFEVVQTFTLSDLTLDGPVPPTARSQLKALKGEYNRRNEEHTEGVMGAAGASSSFGYGNVEEVDGDEIESDTKRRHLETGEGRERGEEEEGEVDPTAVTARFTVPMTTNYLSSALVHPST